MIWRRYSMPQLSDSVNPGTDVTNGLSRPTFLYAAEGGRLISGKAVIFDCDGTLVDSEDLARWTGRVLSDGVSREPKKQHLKYMLARIALRLAILSFGQASLAARAMSPCSTMSGRVDPRKHAKDVAAGGNDNHKRWWRPRSGWNIAVHRVSALGTTARNQRQIRHACAPHEN